ncbi:unnamed protein product [Ceutorhynchus assimilis]|uniref:PEHE domain-containing protein n=1 Tax=Ceutorhynchus assimilis TaxID=467358 RepID=A0A9P0GQI0_9CUCU|nr:unnamed protein product [Ceutorhynchus assimilis]
MGLRTASVGCPNVVMAPALTDATQSQNFNSPTSRCQSPINKFETIVYSPAAVKKCLSPLNTDDLTTSLEPLSLYQKTTQIELYLTELNCASEKKPFNNMNSPPMGDQELQEDKMGLQKTGLNVNNKLRNNSDVVDLFSSNLEANVEDLMQQVIKSIENNDQLNSSSDLTEVLDNINIDKDLLEQVDSIINISMPDQPDDLEAAQRIKENQTTALLTDSETTHHKLKRRLAFLRRRANIISSKLYAAQVSCEFVGVFERINGSVKKTKSLPEVYPYENKPLQVQAAKALIKKIEVAKEVQANAVARQKNVPKYFGSGSLEVTIPRPNNNVNIPEWPDTDKQELTKVTEQLQNQLHFLQNQVDSEATDSSSDAESCDELEVYDNPHQQYLTIQKRALWKYSKKRAALASRWTWLQSQITDLDHRIKQHTELFKKTRLTKGKVQLGDYVIRQQHVLSESEIAGHHDYGSAILESTSLPVNGYLGQLPGATGKAAEDKCGCCARTRPLINFKKRRAFQLSGLHAISKKAARPSTVRCSCVESQTPCALCTGRVDPTHPRDIPDILDKAEKVALLDPCFHPVLSLPEDTSHALHLEAIMKMPEWQFKSLKMKTTKVLQKPERLQPRAYEHRTEKLEHRKKYQRLDSSNNSASGLSEKVKKKRKVGRPAKYKKVINPFHKSEAAREDAEVEPAIAGGSRELRSRRPSVTLDSRSGSPLLQMQSISGFKQNHRLSRVDSYDIDNIVIPYSVAASTRVEKLQYKEILTPKWRILEDDLYIKSEVKNNGSVGISDYMEDSDKEDLADEAVIARHDRSEQEEKKRFLSYMKFPLGSRQRSHKRQDSMAESSGANTPDRASPRPESGKSGLSMADGGVGSSLFMASPPPTPGFSSEEPLPSIAMMRRRTVSQSRLREVVREDEPIMDYVEQPPYESRAFPLPDKEYDLLIKDMPESNRELKTNYRAQDIGDDTLNKTDDDPACEEDVKPDFPDSADSESTESAIGEDAMMDLDYEEEENIMEDEEEDEEDPNDPEWTDVEKTPQRDRHYRHRHHRR